MRKSIKLVQVEFAYLSSDPSSGIGKQKVVWVDASWNLKPGQHVEFEDGSLIWDVIKVYDTQIETDGIYCKWGLGLPKSFRTER